MLILLLYYTYIHTHIVADQAKMNLCKTLGFPKRYTGLIIGKGGRNLRAVKALHDVEIVRGLEVKCGEQMFHFISKQGIFGIYKSLNIPFLSE